MSRKRFRPFELRMGPVAFVVYRVADPPRWEFHRNVYPEVITDDGVGKLIGWAWITGKWCWSFKFRDA